MNYANLKNMVESNNIVIPLYIYKELPKLEIELKTFMFLMYLYSKGKSIPFNINTLNEEFPSNIQEIMSYIDELQKKKLIEIKVTKNEKNVFEEHISIENFYEKISLLMLNSFKEEDYKTDIFSVLESEIGKQLSPIEIELVKGWKEYNYNDDVIKEAIKEAVYNGVANLRYIDKILFTWNKKGLKSVEDIEKDRKEFRGKEKNKPKVEIFDYDWMEDDE